MGLEKSHAIEVANAGTVTLPAAYFMVTAAAFDKLAGSVSYNLLGWRDQATRELRRGALADFMAKHGVLVAAKDALKDAEAARDALRLLPDDTADVIAQKQIAYLQADLVRAQANVDVQTAQLALNQSGEALKVIQPFSVQAVVLQADDAASVVTDGAADLTKIYDREKTGPLSGATNA